MRIPVEQRWRSTDVANRYDAERFQRPLGRFYHLLQTRVLAKVLRRIGPRPQIVDIPCGTGRMLPILNQYACSVTALDVSEAMMAQARCRMLGHERVRFIRGDAKNLPLKGESVDAVFCIRFAMHLTTAERREILREFARVSRAFVVVEYGCNSRWHEVRRFLRRLVCLVLARRHTYPKSVARGEILDEVRSACMDVIGWYWTHRILSESVFVLMAKPPAVCAATAS